MSNDIPEVEFDVDPFEEQYLSAKAYSANVIYEVFDNRHIAVQNMYDPKHSTYKAIYGLSVVQASSTDALSTLPNEAVKLLTDVDDSGGIDIDGKRITNCKYPINGTDAASKKYVDDKLFLDRGTIDNTDYMLLNDGTYTYELFVYNGKLSVTLHT